MKNGQKSCWTRACCSCKFTIRAKNQVFLRNLQRYSLKNQPAIKGWKKEVIAKFYSVSLTSIIKSWLTSEKEDIPAEEVVEGCYLLVTHSIYDLIEKKEKQ